MKWLNDKLKMGEPGQAGISGAFNPVYLDRIMVECLECDKGGVWAAPEGFKIAIAGRLLVTCDKGHSWSISGAYAEEKS